MTGRLAPADLPDAWNARMQEYLGIRPETNRDKRLALYAEANAILAEDAPWAFIYYPVDMIAWQPYVKGFRPHPVWANEYRHVWLDLPKERVSQAMYEGHAK